VSIQIRVFSFRPAVVRHLRVLAGDGLSDADDEKEGRKLKREIESWKG
jgi:hypothetical protein